MGRKKKYNNKEELLEAKRKQWMSYYEKNKQEINALRMKKYYERVGRKKMD